MIALSRLDVATVAHLSSNQLEHLIKNNVLIPDQGGVRKRLSSLETSLAIICGCLIQNGVKPALLKEPIDWLRNTINPQLNEDFYSLNEKERYIQCTVERFAKKYNKEGVDAHFKDIAEQSIGGMYAAYLFNQPVFEHYFSSIEYFEKLKETDNIPDVNKEDLRLHAKNLLENPKNWNIEDIYKAESELEFHFAKTDQRDEYFLLAIDDNGDWETKISNTATKLIGRHSWITIDLRALFLARPIVG